VLQSKTTTTTTKPSIDRFCNSEPHSMRRNRISRYGARSLRHEYQCVYPGVSQDEIAYLTNEDLIAIDQDKFGLQATLVSQDGTWDILTKSLELRAWTMGIAS
jgi:hypothetical protein